MDEQSRLCRYLNEQSCTRDVERRNGYARQANLGDPKGAIGITKCKTMTFGQHWPWVLRGHGDCTKGDHCDHDHAVVHGKGNLAKWFCPQANLKSPWER